MATSTHEEQLYRIFNNVNDWLKFAEAKNAMLIAFNSASIYGISQVLDLELIKNNSFCKYYLFVVIIIMIFSTITSLISFAPKVKILDGGWYSPSNKSNVLFYEYLKTRTNVQIIEEVTGIANTNNFAKIELDLAEQIRQNSIVTSRKYSYFTIAVWLIIAAYITVPVAAIFCLYTYYSN